MAKTLSSNLYVFGWLPRKVHEIRNFYHCCSWSNNACRILLASIKYIGSHLCTTCHILKPQVEFLGMKLHDKTWSCKLRRDSSKHKQNIERAWNLIFNKGYAVNGKLIDRLLGESLVPVQVCHCYYWSIHCPDCSTVGPECIFGAAPPKQLQLLWSFCARYNAWIWIRSMEKCFYAPYLDVVHIWVKHVGWFKPQV